MNAVWNTVAVVLVLIGALLCLTAAIGILRFSDVPSRLHAATKPQVLGVVAIIAGVALSARSWAVVAFAVVVVLLQLATAPLAAHMLGRQAYRNGDVDRAGMVVDELVRDDARGGGGDADPGVAGGRGAAGAPGPAHNPRENS